MADGEDTTFIYFCVNFECAHCVDGECKKTHTECFDYKDPGMIDKYVDDQSS